MLVLVSNSAWMLAGGCQPPVVLPCNDTVVARLKKALTETAARSLTLCCKFDGQLQREKIIAFEALFDPCVHGMPVEWLTHLTSNFRSLCATAFSLQ